MSGRADFPVFIRQRYVQSAAVMPENANNAANIATLMMVVLIIRTCPAASYHILCAAYRPETD